MKNRIKLKETDLLNIVKRILNEEKYSSDPERGTQPREMDIEYMFGPKHGSSVPPDVIRYMRKSPATIFKRLYDIYGDKAYEYLDKAKNSSEHLTEDHEVSNDRYMFFSNLEQIERQTGILLEHNEDEIHSILENGHDWAQDHIATAKESIDQVFDFLMNHLKGDHSEESDYDVMMEEKELTEKKKKNTPTNPKLWKQSLSWARARYKVCPSAYCNGAAVKHYNSKGGKWKKK